MCIQFDFITPYSLRVPLNSIKDVNSLSLALTLTHLPFKKVDLNRG
jgi:hypothetical protein